MLLFANKARSALTGSVTSAVGQVAAITTGSGALFVGVGGVATSTANPMRCVLTAVDTNGNDTGAFEVVEVVRSGDNLTLQSRGLEGTAAAAWAAGTVIECRLTGGSLELGARRIVQSGAGISTTSTNSAGTTLTGSPVTIPAGMMAVGDILTINGLLKHTGNTGVPAVGLNIDGSFPWLIVNASAGDSMVMMITARFAILSTTSSVAMLACDAGSSNIHTSSESTPPVGNGSSHVFDICGYLSGGTDTLALVGYSYELTRGVA